MELWSTFLTSETFFFKYLLCRILTQISVSVVENWLPKKEVGKYTVNKIPTKNQSHKNDFAKSVSSLSWIFPAFVEATWNLHIVGT